VRPFFDLCEGKASFSLILGKMVVLRPPSSCQILTSPRPSPHPMERRGRNAPRFPEIPATELARQSSTSQKTHKSPPSPWGRPG
jgi:hypothetical protein